MKVIMSWPATFNCGLTTFKWNPQDWHYCASANAKKGKQTFLKCCIMWIGLQDETELQSILSNLALWKILFLAWSGIKHPDFKVQYHAEFTLLMSNIKSTEMKKAHPLLFFAYTTLQKVCAKHTVLKTSRLWCHKGNYYWFSEDLERVFFHN